MLCVFAMVFGLLMTAVVLVHRKWLSQRSTLGWDASLSASWWRFLNPTRLLLGPRWDFSSEVVLIMRLWIQDGHLGRTLADVAPCRSSAWKGCARVCWRPRVAIDLWVQVLRRPACHPLQEAEASHAIEIHGGARDYHEGGLGR